MTDKTLNALIETGKVVIAVTYSVEAATAGVTAASAALNSTAG